VLASSDPLSSSIQLWRVADGELLSTLTGNLDIVDSVAFSPDGRILASGARDSTFRLWDLTNGSLLRILEGHTEMVKSVAFLLMERS